MGNVYTTEYLERYEVREEQFSERAPRDKLARELRKQGWTVKCKKWDFTDLARCVAYSLHGVRERKPEVSNV